jgi:hypothetical protein
MKPFTRSCVRHIQPSFRHATKYPMRYLEILNESIENDLGTWFDGSKVTRHGRPMIVYHGGTADTHFDTSYFFSGSNDGEEDEAGFYFTTKKTMAARYGRLVKAYLRVRNPYVVNALQWGMHEGLSPKEAHEKGHDGYRIDGMEGGTIWIVFDPENIRIVQATK